MKRLAAAILLFVSPAAHAAVVAAAGERVLVATRSSIRAFTPGGALLWTGRGLPSPAFIEVAGGGERAAVIDSLADQVALVTPASHDVKVVSVPATPIAAAFSNGSLFVLCRDGRSLVRIDPAGAIVERAAVAPDSVFLQRSGDRLFVYSRVAGRIEEFGTSPLRSRRSAAAEPFASDFEVSASHGYLVIPRKGILVSFPLSDLARRETIPVGAVPTDLAIGGNANAISAGLLLVADSSSKRLWRAEGSQSASAAFGRGFIRGLLGLGLYRSSSSDFPTGIDRIFLTKGHRLAYDSSTKTLFEAGDRPRVLARGTGPHGFAVTSSGVVIWDEERGRLVPAGNRNGMAVATPGTR